MDAKVYLKEYAQSADVFLDDFISQKVKAGRKIDLRISECLKTISDYSSGGKKVRGALTSLGYRLAGGTNFKAILQASCGIELLHDFLLIHDDIVDNDATRHGQPTVHEKYSKIRGQHFGVAKAIIIGDMGAFLGYDLIVQSAFPAERKIEVLARLNDLLLKTVYGEILDIEFDFKAEVSWGDILKVRTYKTAYYTFVMPLTVGAVLGNADGKTIEAIERYGVPVGLAFQLADDMLGVFGDPSKTGKSNESDIREGKKTLLLAKSLELSNKTKKRFLLKWYGAKKLNSEKIAEVRRIMRASGSLDYSTRLAEKLVRKGKKYIPVITPDKKSQDILASIADYVVSRQD